MRTWLFRKEKSQRDSFRAAHLWEKCFSPAQATWTRLLLGLAVILWLLHWVHLQADFPNFSPWMDFSKYTDEGWYGDAAISSILFGHWHNPGGLNTAVALPVWPLIEWLVFCVTGVTVDAARGLTLCIFAGDLALSYAVLRGACFRPVFAAGGVLLLAASSFLWAFDRLAILEPLETFWILGAWLAVLRLRSIPADGRVSRRQALVLAGIGLLCCLAVLTKTTALFLLPSVAILLFAASGWSPRGMAAALGLSVCGGLAPWLAYYLTAARRYHQDFSYFFTVNHWEQPHGLKDHLLAYWWSAHGMLWVGPWLVCATLGLSLICALLAHRVFREPLVLASLTAVAGVAFFMGWHNSPQPRYCMVAAYPIVFAAVAALDVLQDRSCWLARVAAVLLLLIGIRNAWFSMQFAVHPEYTWRTAAEGVTRYIQTHRDQGKSLLLSISADEITLFTHLPGTCDDFGTLPLDERVRLYRPGWYAAWNELDDGTVESIHDAGYTLQRVADWPAFDDDDRNDLVLYRMVPLGGSQPAAPTRESAAP